MAAFGQEDKEVERFSEPLEEARKSGIKFHLLSSLAYGCNNGVFILNFAIILFIGSIFVTESVTNNVRGRDYSPGDIVAIFLGIMFASFSLSLAGPNFKAVTVGRQAAYSAIETINRKPEIDIDCEDSLPLDDLKGDIVFENVSFKYKT